MHTHILFDFFGTLVRYDARRTSQGYPRSHAELVRLGATVSYADFVEGWDRTFAVFDRGSEPEDREFSMTQVGTAYLTEVLGRVPAAGDVDAFIRGYLAEWSAGVSYPEGVVALVRSLSRVYRLAVVTNTHQPDLVPGHLAAMGVLDAMDAVVTSVEVGRRKPHPAIYAEAVQRLGIEPGAAIFVGDTYTADFAGPEKFGMTAYLIDPAGVADVPGDRRLGSVLDLAAKVRASAR
ncbi:HAD family hydrolase [Dactylosporangium sp. NBC_01737]|uniref:HAD family hydrolase n=1 Tax=Dactylosporangium sp. NBC_01737 TaxID=2975959 RepID=UPI002E110A89|nr:HAD family hydrolase [Dactylosporangium sp. NBC_01737]